MLEHLWRRGEANVIDTHAAVGRRRGITANTVGSALERLHRKRLVERRKVSHAYRYAPALDRESFTARRLVDAAGGLRGVAKDGLLAAFVELVAETSEDALDELERLISDKRAQKEP